MARRPKGRDAQKTQSPNTNTDPEARTEDEDEGDALEGIETRIDQAVAASVEKQLGGWTKKINGELAEMRRWREGQAPKRKDDDEEPEKAPKGPTQEDLERSLKDHEALGELKAALSKEIRAALDEQAEGQPTAVRLAIYRAAVLARPKDDEEGRDARGKDKGPGAHKRPTSRTDAPSERGQGTRPSTWKDWVGMKPEAREKLLLDDTFDPRTLPPE